MRTRRAAEMICIYAEEIVMLSFMWWLFVVLTLGMLAPAILMAAGVVVAAVSAAVKVGGRVGGALRGLRAQRAPH